MDGKSHRPDCVDAGFAIVNDDFTSPLVQLDARNLLPHGDHALGNEALSLEGAASSAAMMASSFPTAMSRMVAIKSPMATMQAMMTMYRLKPKVEEHWRPCIIGGTLIVGSTLIGRLSV